MWSAFKSLSNFLGFGEDENDEKDEDQSQVGSSSKMSPQDIQNILESDNDRLMDIIEREQASEYVLMELQGRARKDHRGKISHLNDRVAVIDSQYYFHLRNVPGLPYLRINDKVKCKLYINGMDILVKDVELIDDASDDENAEAQGPPTSTKPKRDLKGMKEFEISGKITRRYGRNVTVQSSYEGFEEIELNLDHVCAEFIPVVGDMVKLDLLIPESGNGRTIVEKIVPSMSMTKSGVVTTWDGNRGVMGKCAVFSILNCEPGYQPTTGDKVLASLIKSNQEGYTWRALQIIPQAKQADSRLAKQGEEMRRDLIRDKQGIVITAQRHKIELKFGEKQTIFVFVSNNGALERKYLSCKLFATKDVTQMTLLEPLETYFDIKPDQDVQFKFEVEGKFLGRSSEQYVWVFRGFKIGRIFDIEVSDPSLDQSSENDSVAPLPRRDVTATQLLDRSSGVIMPGRRSFSPAAFVPVKLGQFSLSEKILKAALPDTKMNLDDLMIRVVKVLPCLKEDLQPKTYLLRMHSLLYLEEVAMLKQVGELELQQATFKRGGDCLILEVPALSAYTTKLVAGDMLIARVPWSNRDDTKYEGVIHRVTNTELHLQFSQDFHDSYMEKTKYSVSFVTSRASLRRMHQAINLAVKHLGMQWLFPTCVNPRPLQVIIKDEKAEAEVAGRAQLASHSNVKITDEMFEAVLAKKRQEGIRAGKKSPVGYLKGLMEELDKMNPNARKSNDLSRRGQPLPKEMLLYSPDPRKLTVDLAKTHLSIEQKLQLPAGQESYGSGKGGGEGGGGGGGGRGGRRWPHHSKDINWNRHGSGYGMHCTVDNESRVKIDLEQEKTIKWFNVGLNQQQKEAVRNVLRGEARPLPYVIFGPPGTGKTVTVVETILQLHALIPQSRLLVATPSNSAADLIAERLLESGSLKEGDLLRMVGYHYLEQGRISASIAPFSAVPDVKAINVVGTSGSSHEGVQMCGRELLGRHRITVGTLGCLGLLYNMGFPRGHFTHVIVDEAGQATEPEVLIPMVFLHMMFGQVVLAGDPLQLGPVVTSRLASRCGLQDSLLSRLLNRFPYTRDPVGFPETSGYDPRLVTKLVKNYRSLPKILKLPSMLFYDNDLVPSVSETDSEEARILAVLGKSFPCGSDGVASPLLFHGVRGENLQEFESHSWYNPHEVLQVTTYLNILYAAGLKADQVGIITPYQLQSNKIRFMIQKMGVDPPKVGSVEEFQGQEKMAIIVSVVRSSPEMITVDMQKALGFVANGRRLNVALSRARGVLIILGNPHLLSLDMHWRSVLKHCVQNNAYIGCDLPPDFMTEFKPPPWADQMEYVE